ncbi:1989_t:CDS:1, partial [Rhizophagus irregularis]
MVIKKEHIKKKEKKYNVEEFLDPRKIIGKRTNIFDKEELDRKRATGGID